MSRIGKHGAGCLVGRLCLGIMLSGALPGFVAADDGRAPVVHVTLGDYRFNPAEITLSAGKPVVLELQNADGIAPHNFTLNDAATGLDIDIDVPAGSVRQVALTPSVSGVYTFYCNKKLPFMKSHHDRGMQGKLVVVPD